MSKILVSEIKPNQEVESAFIVSEKQLRTARNGSPFLTLKLSDKTGEILGRVWENAESIAETIPAKVAVYVRGRGEMFRDEMQIHVQEIRQLGPAEIEPSDFLPCCQIEIDELFDRLKKIVSTIKRRHLNLLIRQFLGDRDLVARFKRAPAAKSMHHAYIGGLLEHTAAVAALVSQLGKQYPDLDRDMLIAGAILHDIGKIDEFVYDLCIDYSSEGRLLGHMVLGLKMLDEKLREAKGFPPEDEMVLKHLILSHHGQASLGAVRLPMTREAFVLHFADDLDAKMNSISRILSETRNGDASWTSYQPLYERFFFRGLPDSLCDDPPADPADLPDQNSGVQLNIAEAIGRLFDSKKDSSVS